MECAWLRLLQELPDAGANLQSTGMHMRILLIEDDGPIADFVCRGLREADLDIDVIADGAEGLRWAMTDTYQPAGMELAHVHG